MVIQGFLKSPFTAVTLPAMDVTLFEGRCAIALLAASILVGGCSGDGSDPRLTTAPQTDNEDTGFCSIPVDEIFDGGPGKDGIPALTDPEMVQAHEPGTEYLTPEDRVIGLVLDDQAVAVPHNVGWYHEIVNLNFGAHQVAITYCPLTGSSLAFDRSAVGGAAFGVSGLLYKNNLMMYDRNTDESLWPQMARGARCGPRDGTELPTLPVYDMTWQAWLALHPDTWVIARPENGPYRVFPYGDYESLDNQETLFPVAINHARPAKERVLGIPLGEMGGIAFPFLSLADAGSRLAVTVELGGKPILVLWDASKSAAVAHEPRIGERELTIDVAAGRFVDLDTGSVWSIDGRAIEGPLAGERLDPVPEAYVAFWFAWAAFHPGARLWGPIRSPVG